MPDSNCNKNCAFSEQMVSYLYGEINARDTTVFESHLKNCSVCANEIAGFGLVRSSIFQWKETEFNFLNSPKIEFSSNRPRKTSEPPASNADAKSRLAVIRGFFSPSPAWAFGLAFLLVSGGLFLFIQNFTKENPAAGNVGKSTRQINNSSERTKQETNNIVENSMPESNPNSVRDPLKSNVSTGEDLIAKENIPNGKKDAAVRISKNSRTAPGNSEIAALPKMKSAFRRKTENANAVVAQRILNNRRQIPKLDNIEDEDEEANLRLTDLLDEIGGK